MKAHPSPEMLSDFALGKLDDAGQLAVSRHIEHCDECRGRVGQISSDSFLDRFRDVQNAGRSQPGTGQATDFVSPARADTLPPGFAENPDYEIKRELGRGGMGVVYLVHNKLMGRDEVVKVLGQHIIARRGVLDRFLREIRAVAKLRHQNIVTAYSATRIGESLVFSMEYVDGLDLARMVKAKGPLPVAHACNFVHQAALGLQHAHEEGLVHRDIKPANLMLARKGTKATIKVLDFGLAKASREEKVDPKLTSDGQALGTPDFIAPEQIRDAQSADIRADIYSLGGTLFFLLTGRPPFQATSLYELYQAHFSRDLDPLNLIRPDIPAELAALVSKMMAKEPEGRFQTPSEVAEALVPFFRRISGVIGSPKLAPSEVGNTVFEGLSPITAHKKALPHKDINGGEISSKTLAEPSDSPTRWETLIEFRDADSSEEAVEVSPETSRRPPWIWPSIVAGTLTLGLIAAWLGGVFKVKTSEGTVVIRNAPENSEVFIDGNKIEITWPGLGKPWIIQSLPGKHVVEVKRDGMTLKANEVTLRVGEAEELTIELVPPTPKKGDQTSLLAFNDKSKSNSASTPHSDQLKMEPKVFTPKDQVDVKSAEAVPTRPRVPDEAMEGTKDLIIPSVPEASPSKAEDKSKKGSRVTAQPKPISPELPKEAEGRLISLINSQDMPGWHAYPSWNPADSTEPSKILRWDGKELATTGEKGGIYYRENLQNFDFKFEYLIPANDPQARNVEVVCITGSRLFLAESESYRLIPVDVGGQQDEIPDKDVFKIHFPMTNCAITSGLFHPKQGDATLHGVGNTAPAQYLARRTFPAESVVGDWNEVAIRCEGSTIQYRLNGRVVNTLREINDQAIVCRPSFIGYNSGPSVHIRNIRITEIPRKIGNPKKKSRISK